MPPQHQDRNPVDIGIENRHARVLQTDHVVGNGNHRLARHFGVAVGHSHRDLFVIAKDDFWLIVATIINDRVMDDRGRLRPD